MRMNFGTLIGLLTLTMFFMDPGSAHATRVRVPEPATVTLLASGAALLGAIGLLRRRKK